MKLIIQIPCFNEEEALPITLADLPRQVAGFYEVEWLVVDDGSTDSTRKSPHARRGLCCAPSPQSGACPRVHDGHRGGLLAGADVIVNTEANNQHRASSIPALVAPILAGRARIILGPRLVATIPNFGPFKKLMQRLGSWAVRVVSGTTDSRHAKRLPCL